MEEAAIANRSDFAVAEKPRNADGSESFLNAFGVVVRSSEKILAATIAAAETSSVNGGALEFLLRAFEEFGHIFHRCGSRTTLKLYCLTRAREGADSDAARIWVSVEQIAD